jgi:hypothetical protein
MLLQIEASEVFTQPLKDPSAFFLGKKEDLAD